jgi:hypothetical protein
MRRNEPDRIPKQFRTLEAAGEFWDTHDLADYWDHTEEVPMSFRVKRRRHFLAIEPGLARKLRAAAEARGVSPETIANLWLREMLGRARAPLRRRGGSRPAA